MSVEQSIFLSATLVQSHAIMLELFVSQETVTCCTVAGDREDATLSYEPLKRAPKRFLAYRLDSGSSFAE